MKNTNLPKLKEILEELEKNNSLPNDNKTILRDIYLYKKKIIKNMKLEKLVRRMDLKRIELLLDTIIDNNEIEDSIDWLIDLSTSKSTGNEIVDLYAVEMENYGVLMMTQLLNENFELCSKIRDVVTIITNDCMRLIRMKNISKEEKENLLDDIKFIYDIHQMSIRKLLEE